jgi:hypothetical protein
MPTGADDNLPRRQIPRPARLAKRLRVGVSSCPVSDSLPPVAIRVARPYATEEALLESELETLTRTSVTLLGAQPQPQGLVLRFELVLSSGAVVMRGEGRVVGYKPNVHDGVGGLTLRFTRLDTRSKTVVDRATALRERRRPSAGAPPPSVPSGTSLFPVPSRYPTGNVSVDVDVDVDVDAPADLSHGGLGLDGPTSTREPDPGPDTSPVLPIDDPEPDTEVQMMTPPVWSPRETTSDPVSVQAERAPIGAPNRDALLERLRVRSKALGHDPLRKLIEPRGTRNE